MRWSEINLIIVWLVCILQIAMTNRIADKSAVCHLPKSLADEIDSYAPIVQRIISEATQGSFKGTTWRDLAAFVDKFGPRFAGTQVLEDAIDYVLNKSIDLGLENVHGEAAIIPRWIRYIISRSLKLHTSASP